MGSEKTKKEDLEELKQVKSILLEIARKTSRDLKFFYQAENKKQRREIYNKNIEYDGSEKTYEVVCKTLCEIVKKECEKRYGLNIELISCDSDEFGHVDILLTTKGNKKYIINCLSDLERMQVGMKSTRFATEKYFDERYTNLLEKSEYSFLSDEENEMIDKEIGNFDLMYTDNFLNILKTDFKDFETLLKEEETLRKKLLGENSSKDDVEKLTKTDLVNIKVKFLMDFCNHRKDLIGHIELVRIVKSVFKNMFSAEERNIMKMYDCFFDGKPNSEKEDVFQAQKERIRFLKIEVGDDIYVITNVKNKYKHCNKEEYERFAQKNGIYEKALAGSGGELAETIRNKGIGVNIIKHYIVGRRLAELDSIFSTLTDEEKEKIIKSINSSENSIDLELGGEHINIGLSNDKITIGVGENSTKYYYENDELVSQTDPKQKIIYHWNDEGKYTPECKPVGSNLDYEGR